MAGFLPQDTLERIRAASDIVDVIGGYLPLKRAGANFTALCPFHKEKSPSFNVNPQKQIFHCFGCHKGGDVFTFVKEYENIGFMDAVRRLADRAKIPIELDVTPGAQEARHIKDQLLQIHEQITQRWQSALANEASGQLARDYLAKRGVSEEATKLFRLGAAPDSWDDTVNWAKSKGHDLATIEKAGLIIRREGADGHYDRFRGRLMFPICDEQGRVIGFSGRVLSGDEKTAKYVNSPETPIFTKSKVFFGLDKSKRAILDAGFAIVCEGQLDLIASFMAGVQNIVAPQGTALTDQHARIIKRYVDEVVLCFDSDNAGQNAAVRSLDSLLASGLAVRVAVVPAPHDPDSFIRANGGEAFRKLVTDAKDFFDYYLSKLCQLNDWSADKGKLHIMREMASALGKTRNSILIDKYEQRTALQLGVHPLSVREEFKKAHAVGITSGDSRDEDDLTPTEDSPPSPQEIWLLRILFRHPELVEWAKENINPFSIKDAHVKRVIEVFFAKEKSEDVKDVVALLASLDGAAAQLVTEVASFNREIPEAVTQLEDIADHLRIRSSIRPRPAKQISQEDQNHRQNLIENLIGRERHLAKLQAIVARLPPASEDRAKFERQIEEMKHQITKLHEALN